MKYVVRTKEIRDEVLRQVSQIRKEPLTQVIIEPYRESRSLEQNAKMWAMLRDISTQVEWYGQKLTDENWKDVFTAALKGQKSAPGIDGGVVFFGQSTRKMNVEDMSDLIESMYAFGAEHEVKWSETIIEEARKVFNNAEIIGEENRQRNKD